MGFTYNTSPWSTSLVVELAGYADMATKAELPRTGAPSTLLELAVTERPVILGVTPTLTELPIANFLRAQLIELLADSS